jgi:superfamily II DNA/RNA helicase
MREPGAHHGAQEQLETPLVRQVAYVVPRPYKLEALTRILDLEAPQSAILFCRTRNEVDELTEALGVRGYRPEALHGGLNQVQRDRVMKKFRDGTADLLIATDVAARGLDVEHVSHVINYDIPQTPEVYVHRIGRTGRAGREGTAITLAQPREQFLLRGIERVVGRPIERARRAHRGRPARAPGGAAARGHPRNAGGRGVRDVPRGGGAAGRAVRPAGDRRGRRQAGRRRHPRRGARERDRDPAVGGARPPERRPRRKPRARAAAATASKATRATGGAAAAGADAAAASP